jgi:hypothetical protein
VPEPIVPPHERTLGDTFEEFVIIDAGRDPAELRFATGPGVTARGGRFTRDTQGTSAAIAALFREFDDIEQVRIELGSVSVSLDDAARWHEILLDVFDTITAAFVPPRVVQPDRQYERAVAEIGSLDVSSPRDLARLLDATSYALRGLAQIGVGRADQSVERRELDDDLRVRFAAEAALDGRIPR